MIHFAADQNFDMDIVRGLRRRTANFTVVHASEAGVSAAEDPDILAWAAREGRIILTQDERTFSTFAYLRLGEGQSSPGVFVIPRRMPIGEAIAELELIVECSEHGEWEGSVWRLPL